MTATIDGVEVGARPGTTKVGQGWQTVRRARWYARWPRFAVGLVVVMFVGLGVRSVIGGGEQVVQAAPTSDQADASSEDFALQFARAYLTYDTSDPSARTGALAPFVGEGFQEDGGFTARSGSQSVEWVDVASDQRALTGGRVITVAAAVSGRSQPVYLAVTVLHRTGQPLALAAYPSLVGAPAIVSPAPEAPGPEVEDKRVAVVVERVLRNYLAGDAPDLKADLTPDAEVTLPTVSLAVQEVQHVEWVGQVESGAVVATVQAADELGDTYTLSYELGVVKRERPYVDFIEVVPTDG